MCCNKCIASRTDAAVRRETNAGLDLGLVHSHRVPLGLILLGQGWITQEQLQCTLELQRSAGQGLFGDWLVARYSISRECITRGLGMQWGCPSLTLENFDPGAMALALPMILMEATGAVPLRVTSNNLLYVGFQHSVDASAALAIQGMSGIRVQSGIVEPEEHEFARIRISESRFVAATFERMMSAECIARNIASAIARLRPRASRLVRVHQFYWLRMWLENSANTDRAGALPRSAEDVRDLIYTVEPQA
jgi:hypothetical protein